MTALTTSIKHFASLGRAPGEPTAQHTYAAGPGAPGVITVPFIAVTADLVELNELFNLYWRRIVPLGQTNSIAFPFTRELVPQIGEDNDRHQLFLSRRSKRKKRIRINPENVY
jgi:putative restriction endonuclease